MKKTKLTRLLAFVLMLTTLFGGALTVNAAIDDGAGSVTTETLSEIREQLNALSYEEYKAKYADVPRATANILIHATEGYTFKKGVSDAEDVRLESHGGVTGLWTPGTGTVTWTTDQVARAAKYSIVIEYWPDDAKSAAIERVLMINGKTPFAEARYLTLPKIWRNAYAAAKVTDPDEEVSVQQLYEEAIAAGFNTETTKQVTENGETYLHVEIPKVWTQKQSEFVNKYNVRFLTTDIDNNEIRPEIQQTPEWRSYELRDADGFYAETFEFVLEPDEDGKVTISLEAVNEPMTIKQIWLVPHEDLISYEDYLAKYGDLGSGTDKVTIQAEYTGASSTQTVYPIEDRADAATVPADTTRTMLNTIGGEKWATAGQWVSYSFTVNASGMYNIAARYRQNVLDGIYVCRAIYIKSTGAQPGSIGYYDGGIPFKEASQIRFNYDSRWQSALLNDGSGVDYKFYFEKGVEYEIRIEVALGSMGDIVRRVENALDAINSDYLAIMKLTGASPDEYRDYGFSRIMPDTLIDMVIQSRELYAIAAELERITGEKSSNVATLERVAWLLERMGTDESEIAKYLEQLKSYIGSLGTWLGNAKTQPLQLDYLVVQPLGAELPKAKAGFFASFLHEIKSFIMSFFRNYDRMGAAAEDSESAEAVEVWIATGRDQAQVLRNLITKDFTGNPDYGIPVNLKLVAGGTLLPSVLSGMGPDVYIGLDEDGVINYAIRGALESIEKNEGFAENFLYYKVDETFHTVYGPDGEPLVNPNSCFNNAAMLVLGIEDAAGDFHYYGLPEQQNFSMMFVRKDVLADLGIEIPKTWDDILAAVPVLQANNMQIGMHQDYKIFLYQMGGELFADNGMRINLDSNIGLEAFDTMCSFFTMYSFPKSYDFANRFRTGEMPIGFAGYTGTYNQLTVFATEIKGLWGFYPVPGIDTGKVDDEGNAIINNVAVSTVTAIVMLHGCDQVDGAWKFMTWHVGADCQSKYANEMVAIIGPSAKHSTANYYALSEMPWTSAEREQILYQFRNLASIPNYPGSYIIGRYTNFAFLAAYEDNADPITELQSYITTINKEITRKRAEFGLETLELGQTLAEKRLLQVQEAFEEDTDKMSDDKLSAAAAAIDMMKAGIKDVDYMALKSAADAFRSVDAGAFADTIKALENAILVLKR